MARQKIAETRRHSIKSLQRRISRELDWVTLRALEKERERRYQSVRELARDLERYLKGEGR